MKTLIKHCMQTYMPKSLLALVEKRHYLRTMREFQLGDEPDLELVKSLTQAGGVALDIGANVGVYTKFLSQFLGAKGRIVSVEPMPRTFEILSHNVSQLGLNNVELVNAAINSASGSVVMELPAYSWGGKNYYQARISSQSTGSGVVVPAMTLDQLVESRQINLDEIQFIKVDVEGFELECLQGANRVLSESGAIWLVEVSEDMDESSSSAGRLLRMFVDQGYAPYINQDAQLVPRLPKSNSVNVFFLKPTHAKHLS